VEAGRSDRRKEDNEGFIRVLYLQSGGRRKEAAQASQHATRHTFHAGELQIQRTESLVREKERGQWRAAEDWRCGSAFLEKVLLRVQTQQKEYYIKKNNTA
jgi:hypothetical protein